MEAGRQLVYGPTYDEMLHPERVSGEIRRRARRASEEDPLDPVNLFNISWRNAAGGVDYLVIDKALTGVDANVVVLCANGFPTGSHKVGATYAVAMERQVEGAIEPGRHRLVWPSTGNYGIGGAWVGPRMGYESLVILPELMSRERFERITEYGGGYIKTHGGESNVWEIYQKCIELAREPDVRVLNQFEVLANYRFHYHVTGGTVEAVVAELAGAGIGDGRAAAFVSAMGSAGTIAAGDRLKQAFPSCRIVGLEPIQCPTLYNNGYGMHDIQGIGDKHVTWIHNCLNMDALMCIDDVECKKGLQLLTEEGGQDYLRGEAGLPAEHVNKLSRVLGISSICNILGAIKTAKYYGLGPGENVVTVATDGIDRYHSVMADMREQYGVVDRSRAMAYVEGIFRGAKLDWIQEGTVQQRQRWFNLKYYTWVEQLGKSVDELDAQREAGWWLAEQQKVAEYDALVRERRGF